MPSRSTGPAIIHQVKAFYIRTEGNHLCVVRSRVNRNHSCFVDVGVSVSLSHGGSAASVLQAYSEPDNPLFQDVRENGYSITRGERLRHYASISIPLFDADRTFLGALTISALSVDATNEDFFGFADLLLERFNDPGLRRGLSSGFQD
ncbi:IclR family transcriptional regulator domain-containing protein [Agrobacterium rosae]|uniref:IclR family transcriptional regulator domain-containing protein n=1 Tax=Agrobacterium rosae TaxID=1972867 RepID=UPI0012949BAC|nr:IclR family transcriptional regulator C-terminal domain-containing protein [Agrobacterium rosae]